MRSSPPAPRAGRDPLSDSDHHRSTSHECVFPDALAARAAAPQLAGVASLSHAEHEARTGLIAATFELDGLGFSGRLVPFDRMRLVVLSYRRDRRRGRRRACAPRRPTSPTSTCRAPGECNSPSETVHDLRDHAGFGSGGPLDPRTCRPGLSGRCGWPWP